MERTEIIPQTSEDLGSGHLYYHFSLLTNSTNPPNPNFEHQIAFFEVKLPSHFTEIKYGTISGSTGADNSLRWDVSQETQWSTQLTAGNWYNFAYDIDFDAQTVGLWASNGSEPLTQQVAPIAASTSTNSQDWHIGQLRLPNGGSDADAEDWFWSGIWIEEAPLTTSVAGPVASNATR
ncbi:uncharacterized protein TRUGW13939_11970 [Talaromyces rugulosus]|uniref:Glycoside hydrolase 131 catalytic N-terminal domain-containing protein n=1 Tax=Talaromyces rugulosus TaxID=121627 RepID=A0A7H8REG9_TALRU|nr:uncharacterized protein TRUGW13939_11970 [Talaromyces rugulosus]QKX64794.1 hypothetical protein TRUGW13939_11970 [Talaromyces rugulosus]